MPRKQISKARVETLLDFNARMFALAHASMQAVGYPISLVVTGLAAQAQVSGISNEDFDDITIRAAKYAREFEAEARKAGVIT